MRKTIFLLMAVSLPFFVLTSCSKDDDDDNGGSGSPAWNNPGKLSVTGSVTDVTAFGATISGWANIDPALAIAAKFGIIVSEDPKPSYSNGMLYSANELNQDNSYQVEVTDLTPGTKYYYVSFVWIDDSFIYGDVKSFTTKEQSVKSVIVTPQEINLEVGSEKQLTAVIVPKDASNTSVMWISGDESVAKVSNSGMVEAVGVGQTTIYAISEDSGVQGTCTCIVTSKNSIIGKWISCDSWSDRMAGIPNYAYIFYENGRGKSMDKGNYYPNQDYDFTWTYDSATGLLTMIDDEAYPGQIREHTATIKDLTKNGFILEEVNVYYGEIYNTYFEKTDKPIYTRQGYEFK